MFTSLPEGATAMLSWSWEQIAPYYRDLMARTLGPDQVADFLADWSRLSERVYEVHSRLQVATTRDTADEDAERRYHAFLDEIYPPSQEAEQRLKEKLLASGLEPAGFDVALRKMRTDAVLFRAANLPLLAKDRKLRVQYDKIIGAQTVQWEGRETTITQLRPVYQSPDRAVRERAWRLAAGRQLADRQALNDLWQALLRLRQQQAANADLPDYRAYRWQQLHRFDYTPADCARFHQAIEEVVVPAATRITERHRQRLGVGSLRPWDLDVDPLGRPPLRPFSNTAELQARAAAIFHRVDPQLGAHFETMIGEGLLDLDNRKHKAPGGYNVTFPAARRPFIFMNAVGLHGDVHTLLHESGHAFHAYERFHLPYYPQRQVGAEFSEVASMAMELLASPYLEAEEGGFYSQADAARARVEHLERMTLFWPRMAVVDAFQHWAYTHPGTAADPDNCDAQWQALWERFMPGVDWSGLDEVLRTGWQRILHIFSFPFYIVEYGLAQLGAVQIWRNALRDQAAAVAQYRRALALGGTVPIPQLYEVAGARFAFDAATLGDEVTLIEETIAALDPS